MYWGRVILPLTFGDSEMKTVNLNETALDVIATAASGVPHAALVLIGCIVGASVFATLAKNLF